MFPEVHLADANEGKKSGATTARSSASTTPAAAAVTPKTPPAKSSTQLKSSSPKAAESSQATSAKGKGQTATEKIGRELTDATGKYTHIQEPTSSIVCFFVVATLIQAQT